ncbi:MAG: NYN domain-containing protein [Dehalococcoidales bacterium]
MKNPQTSYAFIDGNNLHLSVINIGWKLDYKKFRQYLLDKYNVCKAYYFIGQVPGMEQLYSNLQRYGFTLIFKPPIIDKNGDYKGNVDAELVLQAMIDINKYDSAVIVTSDGDFSCLVKYLDTTGKLKRLLAASQGGCSKYLRMAAGIKVDYMDNLKNKLEYIK